MDALRWANIHQDVEIMGNPMHDGVSYDGVSSPRVACWRAINCMHHVLPTDSSSMMPSGPHISSTSVAGQVRCTKSAITETAGVRSSSVTHPLSPAHPPARPSIRCWIQRPGQNSTARPIICALAQNLHEAIFDQTETFQACFCYFNCCRQED